VDLPGKGRDKIANLGSGSSSTALVGGRATREGQSLTWDEATCYFLPHDLKRLEAYARNMVDYHLIMDLIPTLATLFFQHRFPEANLSYVQAAVLLGMGLQRKTIDNLCTELNTPAHQLLALFNKSIRKLNTALKVVQEKQVEKDMEPSFAKAQKQEKVADGMVHKGGDTLKTTLKAGDKEVSKKLKEQRKALLGSSEMMQFAVAGTDEDWNKALDGKAAAPKKLAIKRKKTEGEVAKEKEGREAAFADPADGPKKKKKKKFKKKNGPPK